MTLFGLVRRVIAAPKTPGLELAIVLSAVALAAGIRWMIDRGLNGAPFVTFLPVVVLSAIFLRWPFAVLAGVLSLASVLGFYADTARIQATVTNYMLWGSFSFTVVFMIATGHVLRQTILELEEQGERIRAFNAELQHRTKNTLQIVRALASRASRTTDPVEFYQTLSGRLDAMAKANQLLGSGNVQAFDLGELVQVAMRAFPAGAIHADGPACAVSGQPGMELMMALHELGTNAVKYGALARDGGTVSIGWARSGDVIEIVWEEAGGPPVMPPLKKGLGSRILSPHGPLKRVEIDYRPAGVVCRLAVAAA